jgi:hypothetical protein
MRRGSPRESRDGSGGLLARPSKSEGIGCSGEDDVVSSPLENIGSCYHFVQLTKHKHSKLDYL